MIPAPLLGHGSCGERSRTISRAVQRWKINAALAAEFTLVEAVRLCGLRALCGELRRSFTTARRSRNQTCTYHTPASIVTEGNISARIATNLRISSTERTESTEKMRSERGAFPRTAEPLTFRILSSNTHSFSP